MLQGARRRGLVMSRVHTSDVQIGGYVGNIYANAARAADWLCLAASPAFIAIALLTFVQGRGQQDLLCTAMHNTSPLNGMVSMYLLMAAFHLVPWLRLISDPRGGVRPS